MSKRVDTMRAARRQGVVLAGWTPNWTPDNQTRSERSLAESMALVWDTPRVPLRNPDDSHYITAGPLITIRSHSSEGP